MRKAWTAAAGGLAAALGLVVMWGWHAGRMDLVRLLPALVPMQYDAAVCFALCGAALAALAFGRRRSAAALGAAAAALAAWSMLQAALGVEPGLERMLFSAASSGAVPRSLRLEPLSAVFLLLAGGAVWGRATSRRRLIEPAALLTGAVLAAFGSVVLLCYLTGIASAFGWEYLTRVPPQAGLGFFSIGAGLVAQAWPRDEAGPLNSCWLPAAAGAAVAVAALFLWIALRAEERVRIQWHVDAAASELAGRLRVFQASGRRNGSLRPEELFGTVLRPKTPPAYAFAVYLGREPVYTSPGASDPRPDEYARDVEVRMGGEAGWIRVWPSAELLRVERSRLPAAVGVVGVMLAFLLAWSLHLARLARLQAREIAAASAAKSRFLANISREFGNPLNAIIGFGQVLLRRQDGELNAEQEEDLRAVVDGGWRLASLMDDLLELARLEAGKAAAGLELAEGAEIVEGLRRRFAAEAAKKGLDFRVEVDARAGTVLADPVRLSRALAYLVDNAIKFTRQGEVVLGLRASETEAVFSVRDAGAGISAEEREMIFEPFWQSRRLDAVKKTGGLGLGLFLARKLVELQGGTLTAGTSAGKGAEFLARLPRPRRPEPGGTGT
ncbi:MAG TPA: HAMP domain-containing sensor histidine kinase [Elusimicrobiota bacterium]|jgi:signal transduction histidine kinase|nr:HAMP domain-containing sensor histidine kinase [Elusimicrobiota bacterium]